MQHSKGQMALLLLSLLAIGIAIYLTIIHYENALPICPNNAATDCGAVLSSSYSLVPGTSIPITIPGLAWGLLSAVLALVAWRFRPQDRRLLLAQFVLYLLGMFSVLYLVFAELVRLHTICLWCTALHVAILAMFLISIVHLVQPPADNDGDGEPDEEHASDTTKEIDKARQTR